MYLSPRHICRPLLTSHSSAGKSGRQLTVNHCRGLQTSPLPFNLPCVSPLCLKLLVHLSSIIYLPHLPHLLYCSVLPSSATVTCSSLKGLQRFRVKQQRTNVSESRGAWLNICMRHVDTITVSWFMELIVLFFHSLAQTLGRLRRSVNSRLVLGRPVCYPFTVEPVQRQLRTCV